MNAISRPTLRTDEVRFPPPKVLALLLAGGALVWAITSKAAPPNPAAEPKTVVGKMVQVTRSAIVVESNSASAKQVTADRGRVRMAVTEETEVFLDDESVDLTSLREGDIVRIVPAEGRPGVAARITAARPKSKDADESEAVERRAELADERLAADRRSDSRLDRQRGTSGRELSAGRVFVVELPAGSAAARAGFRPGDVVVFANVGAEDARVFDGLKVRTTGREAAFVIGRSPRSDSDDDPDVEVEVNNIESREPRSNGGLDRRDADVEIDRD